MNTNTFKEVTAAAGINYKGETFGASWGDFNGDNFPDLYVSNHYSRPILYQNEGDGTFTDVTLEVMQKPEGFLQGEWGDQHAAAWADFDNDGDQDLLQVVGAQEGQGTGANQLYVNEGGQLVDQGSTLAPELHLDTCCCAGCQELVDRANALGIDYPQSRGRTPLWLDYDNDGLLDVILAAAERPDGQAPSTIYRQTENGFVQEQQSTGFTPSTINRSFATLSDLSGDSNMELLFRSNNPALTIYDKTSIPFENISAELLSTTVNDTVADLATGDFNGDLLSDLFFARSRGSFSDLVRTGTNRIQTSLIASSNQRGIEFDASGDVTFELDTPVSANNIYIGEEKFNPANSKFTLSANDPSVAGIPAYQPGSDRGIYIGYDTTQQRWSMYWSSPRNFDISTAIVEASEPISELDTVGFNPDNQFISDRLLTNSSQGLLDGSEAAEIGSILNSGDSVVAGDFDNDMDVDAFVIQTTTAGNRPSILYENQGDGTFVTVSDAGGAIESDLGKANSVVTADYNLDGFLDLFTTNGSGGADSQLFFRDGPHQLFQNQGNNNHWLQIDLEGEESNRDGIGAKVFVTAGGVTQVREQTGGMHYAAQNHQRIHFGLAENTVVDEVVIQWPSGNEQRFTDVPADQLIEVTEITGVSEPLDSFPSEQPQYEVGAEEGVFLWQDAPDGLYQLRVNGGNALANFEIELITTNGELLEASPVELEADDELAVSQFGFSLNSQVIDRQDGLDFQLEPGTEALISVTKEGDTEPQQLIFGSAGSQLAPAGWIVDSDELPQRPEFQPGEEVGLFVGQGANPETIEFRSSSDGNFRQSELWAFTDEATAEFSPVGLDGIGKGVDELMRSSNGIELQSSIGTGQDGIDVITTAPVRIGFAYQQDGSFESQWVNPNSDLLGFQNAYWLPSVV